MSPVCDGTRMLLGFIATVGGMVFAGMTNVMKTDIKALSRRLFPGRRSKPLAPRAARPLSMAQVLKWLLLVTSLGVTLLLGSYVAAVPSKTCVNLIISELVCHPEGDELEGELVRLQNLSNRKINLNDWTLCDYRNNHCYQFQSVGIQPHATLTIWTKAGADSVGDLYFGEERPIWNNGEDTAYLYDLKEQLIHQLPCPK